MLQQTLPQMETHTHIIHGNINITVTGDFGQLTFETLSDSYMGGFRKLMFNSGNDSTKGEAVHHWGENTYYNMLTSDPSDAPQNYRALMCELISRNTSREDYVISICWLRSQRSH